LIGRGEKMFDLLIVAGAAQQRQTAALHPFPNAVEMLREVTKKWLMWKWTFSKAARGLRAQAACPG